MNRRKRRGRSVNGILVLDKPMGLTSNGALQEVKRLYGAAKAGHTGSLDPLATGVLPLCFGEATKFSQYLLNADKRYLATVQLGIETDSGDADGKVIAEHEVDDYSDATIAEALGAFTGKIDQIPSMFSALKHKGEPLYKLARQGIEIEREPRSVIIHSMVLKNRTVDRLTLDIHCTKGTYIRSLASDLGERLGCGGHIRELRRTAAGPYEVEAAYTIKDLEAIRETEGHAGLDRLLLGVASSVEDWPSVELTDTTAYYFRQGQPVQVSRAPLSGWVRVLVSGEENTLEFIGVGEITDDGKIAPRRLVETS